MEKCSLDFILVELVQLDQLFMCFFLVGGGGGGGGLFCSNS